MGPDDEGQRRSARGRPEWGSAHSTGGARQVDDTASVSQFGGFGDFESVGDGSESEYGSQAVGAASPATPAGDWRSAPGADTLAQLLATPGGGYSLPRPGTVLMRVPEAEEAEPSPSSDESGGPARGGGAAAAAGRGHSPAMVVLAGDARAGEAADLGRLFAAAARDASAAGGSPERLEAVRPGQASRPQGRQQQSVQRPRDERPGTGAVAPPGGRGTAPSSSAPGSGGDAAGSFAFSPAGPPLPEAAEAPLFRQWQLLPGNGGAVMAPSPVAAPPLEEGPLAGGGGYLTRGGELLMRPGVLPGAASRFSDSADEGTPPLRGRGGGPATVYGAAAGWRPSRPRSGDAGGVSGREQPSWRVSYPAAPGEPPAGPYPTPAASGSGEAALREAEQRWGHASDGEAASADAPQGWGAGPLGAQQRALARVYALSAEAIRGQPLPPAFGVMQCYVAQDTSKSRLFPVYKLFQQGRDGAPDRFLLAAQLEAGLPLVQNKRYIFSTDPDNCSRGSPGYYGMLRSNTLGTKFTIYDAGAKAGAAAGGSERRVLGVIVFEPTTGSAAGSYRKMSTLLPNQLRTGADGRPRIESWEDIKDGRDMHLLTSKVPNYKNINGSWHYCYKFGGRVKVPSVKNCQLVLDGNQDLVVLLFGKITGTLFACDFTAPLSAAQAFAIALASVDPKLCYLV